MQDKHIVENLVEIDIEKDFMTVSSGCRESIYFLQAITGLLKGVVCMNENQEALEESISIYKEKIKSIETEYNEIDNKLINPVNDTIENKLEEFNNDNHLFETTHDQLMEIIISFLKIKSKSDRLQLEILNELIDIKIDLCTNLSKNNEKLELLMMEYQNQYLCYKVFNKSSESDKILNISFKCADRRSSKDLRNNNMFNSKYKIRDYTYELKQARLMYSKWQENIIELTKQTHYVAEENNREAREKTLFQYNKRVMYLTYVTVAIAIITFLGVDIKGIIGTQKAQAVGIENIDELHTTTSSSIKMEIAD